MLSLHTIIKILKMLQNLKDVFAYFFNVQNIFKLRIGIISTNFEIKNPNSTHYTFAQFFCFGMVKSEEKMPFYVVKSRTLKICLAIIIVSCNFKTLFK